jgi:superfamily II DNA or RNA helicase
VRLPLRDYQQESIDAVITALRSDNRQAIQLPTGMGKTVVAVHLIEKMRCSPVVILVHRDELAQQFADKVEAILGEAPGIVKAERNDVHSRVIVASVQTLARRSRRAQLPQPALIIVDEAHHAAAPSWRAVLDDLGAFSGTNTVGLSATLWGKDLADVWPAPCYTRSVAYGVRNGYLADPVGVQVTVKGMDLHSVAKSGGDFRDGALGTTMVDANAGPVIAAAYKEHAGDRLGILFAPTVAAAELWTQDFKDAGITAATILGTTSAEERALFYKMQRHGDLQVLLSCMVLTEGFDAPWVSAAAIARPTHKPLTYIQMVGRALRPWPGKKDALILDVVGATQRHSLCHLGDLSEAPLKVENGESFLSAVNRRQREKSAFKFGKDFEVSKTSLLDDSRYVWLSTEKGVPFIPTMNWNYFIWPENDEETLWKVGRRPGIKNRDNGGWLETGLPIEHAKASCERFAFLSGDSVNVSGKSATWRRRRLQEGSGQARFLRNLGIAPHDGMTVGEASNAISVKLLSRDIDRFV